MDFEEFKKYHNANYHDGDSTFDELNYKRSNGDDFDNEFVQDCFDHFEAGQQSKQAEIDALQQQNQRLAMRLDVIQGVLQKQIDLIVELKNDT